MQYKLRQPQRAPAVSADYDLAPPLDFAFFQSGAQL
jgi:hypothetical protein